MTDIVPDHYEFYAGPSQSLTRQQLYVLEKLQALVSVTEETVAALATNLTPDIVDAEQRIANLLYQAKSSVNWRDYSTAARLSKEITGALSELKQLGRQQGLRP